MAGVLVVMASSACASGSDGATVSTAALAGHEVSSAPAFAPSALPSASTPAAPSSPPPVPSAPARPPGLPPEATFARDRSTKPVARLSVLFDSPAGAKTRLTNGFFAKNPETLIRAEGGAVTVVLEDASGAAFPSLVGVTDMETAFVVSVPEQAYTVVVKNVSDRSLELLVAIDFRDVFTGDYNAGIGDEYAFPGRGTMLAPGTEIEITGYRQDAESPFRVPSPPGRSLGGSGGGMRGIMGRGTTKVRLVAYAAP